MSKVKRLRKKYRALCSNVKSASNVCSRDKPKESGSKVKQINLEKNEQKNQVNALYDMIIDAKGNTTSDLDSRSTYSISKSIKSNLSGQSILKKNKQRLKHELFLKKLESSAQLMSQLKKSKRNKSKKIHFSDDLPSLTINEEKPGKSYGFVSKNMKVPLKNRHSGKGLTKRRNMQMMKDIEQFQNLLEKKADSKGQFDEIQRRILDRLSNESVDSMKDPRQK